MTDNGKYAVFPHMKIDEEQDRSEIGRGSWTIGLARPDGQPAAELVLACDQITPMGPNSDSIAVWSLWDESGEKRDEPIMTMGLAAGTWTYFHMNDPWGLPLPVVKGLSIFGSSTTVK
jgi:hypothetical protein